MTTYNRDDAPQATLGSIIVRGLNVDVRIKDRKVFNGKTRYLVAPVTGSGDIWLETVYFKREDRDNGS